MGKKHVKKIIVHVDPSEILLSNFAQTKKSALLMKMKQHKLLGLTHNKRSTKEGNRSRNLSQTNQQSTTRYPFQQKLSTFICLIHRLITLPTTKPKYKRELRFIE